LLLLFPQQQELFPPQKQQIRMTMIMSHKQELSLFKHMFDTSFQVLEPVYAQGGKKEPDHGKIELVEQIFGSI
jgi:hypothetical protein